jgi:hypothetical protein
MHRAASSLQRAVASLLWLQGFTLEMGIVSVKNNNLVSEIDNEK